MTVGERIRERRQAKKMSLAGVAAKLGKAKTTVLRYETGRIPVSVQELERIAKVLRCPVRSLVPPGRSRAA